MVGLDAFFLGALGSKSWLLLTIAGVAQGHPASLFELHMSLRSLWPAEPLCAADSAEETMGRREPRFYTLWPSCHPVPHETVSFEGFSYSTGSRLFWGHLYTASLYAMRNLASRTLHKSGCEGKALSLVWSCSALKVSRFGLS